ncbi:MAG TPA: formyltransferase family protein [Gaiellaceae bacterium]|nr:formyltransferase family protein [Gaiellaceae bacterium]
MSWRVVIVTRVPQVLAGFDAVLQALGHETVALLTIRSPDDPTDADIELVLRAPEALDVLLPARRSTIAPLLAAVQPDLVVCMGFPWRVPPEALAVPRLGWLNGHPSLLPAHRGPLPVAWAIRAGDEEIGITFHRMDAELDTGPILSQRPFALAGLEAPDSFYGRFGEVIGEALAEALQRLAAGEEGTPQEEGGSYESFFSAEDAWIDLSGPAAEVHRLVWAWLYAFFPGGGARGALLELDGKPVRVLATSLTEVEGARRLDCADGPLWLVETEELSEEEASRSSAPAPSTR